MNRTHYSDYSTSKYPRMGHSITGSTVYSKPLNHDNPGPNTYRGHEAWIKESVPESESFRDKYDVVYQYKHGASIPNTKVNIQKNKNYKTGEKGDTVTIYTYEPDDTKTRRTANIHDFTKSRNDRSLWVQQNDKFNVYVEKENPGPGNYEYERSMSVNGVSSVFQSKSKKLASKKLLNETIQYFQENEDRFEKKPDTLTRESRDMRWTFNHSTPYSKPDNLENPGPQAYKTKKEKLVRINSQPFNSSNKRNLTKEANKNPGPGEYKVVKALGTKIKSEDLRGQNNGLVNYFGGKTEKFKFSPFAPKEGPPPGTYEEFKKEKTCGINYRQSKAPKDTQMVGGKIFVCGDQKKPSFNHYNPGKTKFRQFNDSNKLSSTRNDTQRFFSNQVNWLGDKEIAPKPGPGQYEVANANTERLNKKFNSTSSRFENYFYKSKNQTSQSVGPGSYVEPSYKVPKSFNCTLNENVFRITNESTAYSPTRTSMQ